MTGFSRLVHESWLPILQPHSKTLITILEYLEVEKQHGHQVHPDEERIFASFSIPFDRVRVLIMGQDPYPTPGHAMGYAFSVQPNIRPFPKSLKNIFNELVSDINCQQPTTGDLTPWVDKGVMLLNRVLSVRSGSAGSHRSIGWQTITDAVVTGLVQRKQPLVAVLWGNDAAAVMPLLQGVPIVQSAHPSPLSAHRGFIGSKPFSTVNHLLVGLGAEPIDWCLP